VGPLAITALTYRGPSPRACAGLMRSNEQKNSHECHISQLTSTASANYLLLICRKMLFQVNALSTSLVHWLQLRFDLDSTAVRLLIKGH